MAHSCKLWAYRSTALWHVQLSGRLACLPSHELAFHQSCEVDSWDRYVECIRLILPIISVHDQCFKCFVKLVILFIILKFGHELIISTVDLFVSTFHLSCRLLAFRRGVIGRPTSVFSAHKAFLRLVSWLVILLLARSGGSGWSFVSVINKIGVWFEVLIEGEYSVWVLHG